MARKRMKTRQRRSNGRANGTAVTVYMRPVVTTVTHNTITYGDLRIPVNLTGGPFKVLKAKYEFVATPTTGAPITGNPAAITQLVIPSLSGVNSEAIGKATIASANGGSRTAWVRNTISNDFGTRDPSSPLLRIDEGGQANSTGNLTVWMLQQQASIVPGAGRDILFIRSELSKTQESCVENTPFEEISRLEALDLDSQ